MKDLSTLTHFRSGMVVTTYFSLLSCAKQWYLLTYTAVFSEAVTSIYFCNINAIAEGEKWKDYVLRQVIIDAILSGNRKLAAKMIEKFAQNNFNELHIQVLANDNEPLKPFRLVYCIFGFTRIRALSF